MLTAIRWTVVALALTTSCAGVPPVRRIPFPEAEYAALPSTGPSTVRGQAFLKTRGGDVKTAAGEEILLNPVTSYSEQWYEHGYLGGRALTSADPRYAKYHRKTIADGDGRFTFSSIPAGEYFLVAQVVWDAPVGYRGSLVQQGGYVAKRISVPDGGEIEVIVTR